MSDAFVLVLSAPVPAFGASAGDRILVRLGHKNPMLLLRDLPRDYALLEGVLTAGTAEMVSPDHTIENLISQLRSLAERPTRPATPVTEADVDAALALLDSTTPLVEEIDACQLYPDYNQRGEFLGQHWRVLNHWPRTCRQCGKEFRPTHRVWVRCPECKAAARKALRG